MGRLYSGNLNDFKAATNKLFELDLAVICDDSREDYGYIRVHIEDRTGNMIDGRAFIHCDEDVLYSMATAWLNFMYAQLKDWK